MDKIKFDAVVLADGDYPTSDTPLGILHDTGYVACCDGAANGYISRGRVPDVIVGDGDSICPEYREKYAERIVRIAEQESNDLTKTVTYIASLNKKSIAIVGATGRREDHTLANVSLILEYMRMGLNVRLYTDNGVFIPCCGTTTLKATVGRQVSIFNFTAKGMSAEGLMYPIRDFTSWWQGTLNECTADAFTINAEGEYIVFINY